MDDKDWSQYMDFDIAHWCMQDQHRNQHLLYIQVEPRLVDARSIVLGLQLNRVDIYTLVDGW